MLNKRIKKRGFTSLFPDLFFFSFLLTLVGFCLLSHLSHSIPDLYLHHPLQGQGKSYPKADSKISIMSRKSRGPKITKSHPQILLQLSERCSFKPPIKQINLSLITQPSHRSHSQTRASIKKQYSSKTDQRVSSPFCHIR